MAGNMHLKFVDEDETAVLSSSLRFTSRGNSHKRPTLLEQTGAVPTLNPRMPRDHTSSEIVF